MELNNIQQSCLIEKLHMAITLSIIKDLCINLERKVNSIESSEKKINILNKCKMDVQKILVIIADTQDQIDNNLKFLP